VRRGRRPEPVLRIIINPFPAPNRGAELGGSWPPLRQRNGAKGLLCE
jgi:hypothetical protein